MDKRNDCVLVAPEEYENHISSLESERIDCDYNDTYIDKAIYDIKIERHNEDLPLFNATTNHIRLTLDTSSIKKERTKSFITKRASMFSYSFEEEIINSTKFDDLRIMYTPNPVYDYARRDNSYNDMSSIECIYLDIDHEIEKNKVDEITKSIKNFCSYDSTVEIRKTMNNLYKSHYRIDIDSVDIHRKNSSFQRCLEAFLLFHRIVTPAELKQIQSDDSDQLPVLMYKFADALQKLRYIIRSSNRMNKVEKNSMIISLRGLSRKIILMANIFKKNDVQNKSEMLCQLKKKIQQNICDNINKDLNIEADEKISNEVNHLIGVSSFDENVKMNGSRGYYTYKKNDKHVSLIDLVRETINEEDLIKIVNDHITKKNERQVKIEYTMNEFMNDIANRMYLKTSELMSFYLYSTSTSGAKVTKFINPKDMLSVIKKAWTKGNRQKLAMHFSGFCARTKVSEEETKAMIMEICKDTCDSEVSMRISAATSTFNAIRSGKKEITGFKRLTTSLNKILGAEEVATFVNISKAKEDKYYIIRDIDRGHDLSSLDTKSTYFRTIVGHSVVMSKIMSVLNKHNHFGLSRTPADRLELIESDENIIAMFKSEKNLYNDVIPSLVKVLEHYNFIEVKYIGGNKLGTVKYSITDEGKRYFNNRLRYLEDNDGNVFECLLGIIHLNAFYVKQTGHVLIKNTTTSKNNVANCPKKPTSINIIKTMSWYKNINFTGNIQAPMFLESEREEFDFLPDSRKIANPYIKHYKRKMESTTHVDVDYDTSLNYVNHSIEVCNEFASMCPSKTMIKTVDAIFEKNIDKTINDNFDLIITGKQKRNVAFYNMFENIRDFVGDRENFEFYTPCELNSVKNFRTFKNEFDLERRIENGNKNNEITKYNNKSEKFCKRELEILKF